MKYLSYDTLCNIRDMLQKQINKEKISTTLFNFNKDKLLSLQNDKKIIDEAISLLLQDSYYQKG